MSHQSAIIEHVGVVETVSEKTICVTISSSSACGSCHAKGACSMSDQELKQVFLPNIGQDVVVGETVNLVIKASTGLKSVLLAYVIPVILLVTGLGIYSVVFKSEGLSAILALLTIIIYYLLLYLFRRRLERRFVMKIEKY